MRTRIYETDSSKSVNRTQGDLPFVSRGKPNYSVVPSALPSPEKISFSVRNFCGMIFPTSSKHLPMFSSIPNTMVRCSTLCSLLFSIRAWLSIYYPHFLIAGSIAYEFNEQVASTMNFEVDKFHHTPAALALETAHNVAFHGGLGSSRLALTNKYLTNKSITEYSKKVYNKDNVAVVASGAPQPDLEKWTAEFFNELPSGVGPAVAPAQYYGGENRLFSPHGDAIVIAFPGSASAQAEYTVLAHLLGGEASIKWNTGMSLLSQTVLDIPHTTAVAKHVSYTDAGLLYVAIEGPGSALTQAGKNVVSAIKSLGEAKPEDIKRAIALAKFGVLAAAEDRSIGLESVGQTVIASGKAPQVESIVKALDGVTASAVKAVCPLCYTFYMPVAG